KVGGTFCGGAGGGGGGGGGGGAPSTPLRSPPTTPPATPPSTPPSTPFGSPLSSTTCGCCLSILTGWTMSLTLIFFGVIWTVCGFAPPGGGGGGGGGGGATARSMLVFGRSSCSISQIVLIHIVTNSAMWKMAAAPSKGTAHFGILRFFAAV